MIALKLILLQMKNIIEKVKSEISSSGEIINVTW